MFAYSPGNHPRTSDTPSERVTANVRKEDPGPKWMLAPSTMTLLTVANAKRSVELNVRDVPPPVKVKVQLSM